MHFLLISSSFRLKQHLTNNIFTYLKEPPPLKPHTAILRIKEALNFIRNEFFEIPFIASYRKENIQPELNIDDLWKIYEMDEKVDIYLFLFKI